MIVHPIGMMRANAAASGLNFVDDFSTYTVGNNLVGQGPYVLAPSWFQHVTVADVSGTKVAQNDSSDAIIQYDDGVNTVASDRRVAMTLHTIWDGVGGSMRLYVSYVDDNNYIELTITVLGAPVLRVKTSGTMVVSWDGTNGTFAAGDKVEMTLVSGTLTVKKNTTTIRTESSFSVPTIAKPAFRLRCVGTPTVAAARISTFEVEEL